MLEKIKCNQDFKASFAGQLLSRGSFSGSLLFMLGCLFLLYLTGQIPRIQPQGQLPVVVWPVFMLMAMIVISLGKAVHAFVICYRERRCPPEGTASVMDKGLADAYGPVILGGLVEGAIKDAATAKGETSLTEIKVKRDYKVVTGCGLIVLLYIILMDFSGFALANFIFMLCFLLFTGERKPLRLALLTLLSTVVFLYVFVKIIYVSLPLGKGFFADFTVALYRFLRVY